jgi:hypothetical protein
MKLKDWSERLIWATILISIVRYAAAFAASDVGEITGIWSNILTGLLSFTGIGMGMLDTIGGGLLFNGWSRVLPKQGTKGSTRFHILSVCVGTLLFSGLFILVPFTMSRLSHESILVALGGKNSFWSWAWSLMVNLIPYVLIAGVFVGNKMVTALETEESSKNVPGQVESSMESSKNVPGTDWRKFRPTLTRKDIEQIANLNPDQIRKYASETGYTYKTISNWRSRARQELGIDIMSTGEE